MKNTIVFEKPGMQQKEILAEMRGELKKLMQTPRNAPCPCGMKKPDGKAKKFKHCCLANIP